MGGLWEEEEASRRGASVEQSGVPGSQTLDRGHFLLFRWLQLKCVCVCVVREGLGGGGGSVLQPLAAHQPAVEHHSVSYRA